MLGFTFDRLTKFQTIRSGNAKAVAVAKSNKYFTC